MSKELDAIQLHAEKAIDEAKSAQDLRSIEVKTMGRKGELTILLRSLKNLSVQERRTIGQRANELKKDLSARITARKKVLSVSGDSMIAYDPTIPGKPTGRGALHPVTLMLRKIWETFTAMGYEIVEGPEVETDQNNFQTLNIPPNHPARDEQDTYYVNIGKTSEHLLRTQMTTTSISRAIPERKLPIKLIATGKCYRRDAADATHVAMFHQFDGIVVDEGITMTDLKGTLHAAMRSILDADVDVRFRISYFPFTEPSAEFDFSCTICGGSGCTTCKQSGWIEMGGCGMIHPNVIANVGFDPERVTGLAFGFGVERPFMIKHRIANMRHFTENDLRFIHQFNR